jgi:hypothetical protein
VSTDYEYHCYYGDELTMELIKQFGERWARNSENIKDKRMPGKRKGGQGVYILYDGSTPVYIGKGNIRARLIDADKDKRRKDCWDHFSWYVINDESLRHDVEVLLIRMLPIYLRHLTRQRGHFKGDSSTRQDKLNRIPDYIRPPKFMRSSK